MRRFVIAATLIVVTLAVFWPILGHDFIGIDDQVMVAKNPDLHPPNFQGVLRYWANSARALYMPMTYTVWAATAALTDHAGGPSPMWFHALSLCVHTITVLGVGVLLKELFADARAATIGAILFALHPLQVETVAWVAEAKDLLAGLFAVGALWQYVRYVKVSSTRPEDQNIAWAHYLAATMGFALAMLYKPSAVVVPAIAAVIDVGVLRRSVRQVARSIWPWLVLAVPFILIAQDAQQGVFQPVLGDERTLPAWWRPIVAADAISFYLGKLVWPAHLGIDYGRSPWQVMSQAWVWWTSGVAVALAFVLWIGRRKVSGLSIGLALMVAALLPTLGLVPFDFQEKSTVTDHYMYLAMLGPALAACWCLARWTGRANVTIALLVLAVFAARSRVQTAHWRDGETCYRHGLAVNPQSWWLWDIVGYELMSAEKPAEAIEPLRNAIAIAPGYAAAQAHLGVALAETRQFPEAVERLQKSLVIEEHQPQVQMLLGDVHMLRSQFDEARQRYKTASSQDPNLPGVAERLQRAAAAASQG
jgi:protein O-mannosyl-transferase